MHPLLSTKVYLYVKNCKTPPIKPVRPKELKNCKNIKERVVYSMK